MALAGSVAKAVTLTAAHARHSGRAMAKPPAYDPPPPTALHAPKGRLLSSLDPKAPLVLDTRELARRPGSSRRVSRLVPAPANLGIAMMGVSEGTAMELACLLESVVEGVLVSGTAQVRLAGECARCLDAIGDSLAVEFQELYVYPESDALDDEASRLNNELLDLEPAIRDAVVLALPFQPVCREDCPGLCQECGQRLADDPQHSHGEQVDPRWAALAALTDDDAGLSRPGRDKE